MTAWSDRRIALILATVFLIFCMACHNSPGNPNSLTRVALADAMVVRHELTVDAIAPLSDDKALRAGHYYSDKAPGVALMSLPLVAVAEAIGDAEGLAPGLTQPGGLSPRYTLVYFAALLTAAGIAAAGLAVFFLALRRAAVEQRKAAAVAVFFGFGTQYLMWATALFGHSAAAALLFMALAAGWRERPLLAGVLLGLAVMTELPAAPAAGVIAIFIVFKNQRVIPGFSLLIAGGLGPMIVLAAYNAAAFGSPLAVGYGAVSGFAGMKTGFFGIQLPDPGVIFAIIAGRYRGILWLSPVLAIGAAAGFALLRDSATRATSLLVLGITAWYLALNGGYYYWDGGFSTGPRHLTPVVPFLMFALGLWVQRMPRAVWAATVVLGLLGVAVCVTASVATVVAPNDGVAMLTHVARDMMAGAAIGWLVPLMAVLIAAAVVVPTLKARAA